MNFRSIVSVPMLRDGRRSGRSPSHVLTPALSRTTQIALLKTFADQAVIAIENVRLFREVQIAQPRPDRGAGATDRDERDPPRDQPVADGRKAGVRCDRERAMMLCVRHRPKSFMFDGELLPCRGRVNKTRTTAGSARLCPDSRVRRRLRAIHDGAALSDRGSCWRHRGWNSRSVANCERIGLSQRPRRAADARGSPIGGIAVWSAEPGPFPEELVALLQDVRRSGGDRHRERAAVQGTGGAHHRVDAVGGRTEGARRGRTGGQLDTRPGDRAAHDRRRVRLNSPAWTRRDLRVRRGA